MSFAVGTIVFTVLALSLGDALIKFTSNTFVIWQLFVVRSAIAIPLLYSYLVVKAPSALQWPSKFLWTAARSLILVAMWISYYLSLPHLQLSVAAATYYTLPIFITLFSAAIIGDKISRLGWIAVFLGFLGVLLILRPNAGDFNWFAILPLFSAILYASAMILTRTKCRAEHPIILSLALNITFVAVGSIAAILIEIFASGTREGFLLAAWVEMGQTQWVAMALLAISILIGSVGTAIAYQNAPPAVIGTFDFAYVGFAVLWGIVFFTEIPDGVSILGMMLIVVAGIMSLRK
ncbi:DMT family transporter [Vacuolonema iberomarrocanum]|uniref:DMT family transporter n=1 Tax=Vacuolonema iberomarrocanum TaxID=3454632 RepID=UPI003F6E0C81